MHNWPIDLRGGGVGWGGGVCVPWGLAFASTISKWSSDRLVMTTLRGCRTARVRGEVRCKCALTWKSRMCNGSSPPVLVMPISRQKLLIPCTVTSSMLPKTKHSTAQHGAAQHGAAQHGIAWRSSAQHGIARRSSARHSAAQHGTAQPNAAQHSAPQRSSAMRDSTAYALLSDAMKRTSHTHTRRTTLVTPLLLRPARVSNRGSSQPRTKP